MPGNPRLNQEVRGRGVRDSQPRAPRYTPLVLAARCAACTATLTNKGSPCCERLIWSDFHNSLLHYTPRTRPLRDTDLPYQHTRLPPFSHARRLHARDTIAKSLRTTWVLFQRSGACIQLAGGLLGSCGGHKQRFMNPCSGPFGRIASDTNDCRRIA